MRDSIERSWYKIFDKMQKPCQLSVCDFKFTPRQGSLVVAATQVVAITLTLTVLTIGLVTSFEVLEEVTASLQEIENNWAEKFGNKTTLPPSYREQEEKLLHGQREAKLVVSVLLGFTSIILAHFYTSLQLFQGVVKEDVRRLELWLLSLIIILVVAFIMFTGFVVLRDLVECKCVVLSGIVLFVFLFILLTKSWLIVLTYYMELLQKRKGQEVENIMPANINHDEMKPKKIDL